MAVSDKYPAIIKSPSEDKYAVRDHLFKGSDASSGFADFERAAAPQHAIER